MRTLGWLVFFKEWDYDFCVCLCNSHFSVKSESFQHYVQCSRKKYSFSPPFLNITSNVTVFFPTCSQIHGQHWKRPSPPGSVSRCYPSSHCRRIPLCLARWPAIPIGSRPFTLNCRTAKKLVFMENRWTLSFFLYQIKDTWSLRTLAHHPIPTCHKLAAENCSISPLCSAASQGKVPGAVLQERQWPNCKTCASPTRPPHREKSHPRSPLSYLLASCYRLI